MKLVVVLAGWQCEPGDLLPDGATTSFEPGVAGPTTSAAWLALLGQDPRMFSGPAPFALATAGQVLAEDESAYLLTPVRAEEERIVAVAPATTGPMRGLLHKLAGALDPEPVQIVPQATPPVLVVAEPHVGPARPQPDRLPGRLLSELPPGPPKLLEDLVAASARLCAQASTPATHVFPNTPGGPSRARPLRETWLGVGPSAAVGGPAARGLATLLGLTYIPGGRGSETPAIAWAEGDAYDVVVVLPRDTADLGPLQGAPAIAVAGIPTLDRVPLAWRAPAGVALGEGLDALEPLARKM